MLQITHEELIVVKQTIRNEQMLIFERKQHLNYIPSLNKPLFNAISTFIGYIMPRLFL